MYQKKINNFLSFFLSLILICLISYSSNGKEYYSLDIPEKIDIYLTKKNFGKFFQYQYGANIDGSFEEKKNILRKYKKPIKAKISLNKKIINCKISITGDWKDHLSYPFSSLKVEILGNDNYFNVKKFKLLLPQTRNFENEIFWTLLLKSIGFPVFHSQFIDVSINGITYKAIFQEDASKEFLERNGFRETVILRNNDYHFYTKMAFYNSVFSRSQLIENEEFVETQNLNAINIASKAISLYSANNFFDLVQHNKLFEKILEKYGEHGLNYFNRKYIFEPYYNQFIPLYYDGMTSTRYIDANNDLDKNCNFINNNDKFKNFEKQFYKLSGLKIDTEKKCIYQEIMDYYERYRNSSFNYEPMDNLRLSGYDAQYEQYKHLKKLILKFINQNYIEKSPINILSQTSIYSQALLGFNNDPVHILNKMNVFSFEYNDEYYICFYNFDGIEHTVKIRKINVNDYIKIISKKTKIKNSEIFIINLGLISQEKNIINLIDNSNKEIIKYELTEPALYLFSSNGNQKKNYYFNFFNKDSRLLISNQLIKKNTLNFYSHINWEKEKLNTSSRFDKNLLTGCVTIIDSIIEDVNIFSSNMHCEDAVNIIKSEGVISELKINNSKYDALDIDYSEISILNSSITNSGNDCIDLSFGNYNINLAKLNNCNDKGISVGEKSKTKIYETSISNSNIAIAAKDGSEIFVGNSIATKITNFCLAAYNKKSEFNGAEITYKNFQCDKNNYFDNFSIIKNEQD